LIVRQGIYTILRDKSTSRQDWIFFVDRVSTFLVEKALEHVPYRPKTVITPTGSEAHGKELDVSVSAS
jgi:uridine kinase